MTDKHTESQSMSLAEAEALGRRLVACEGFRLMAGMRVRAGLVEWRGWHRITEGTANLPVIPPGGDFWPDLRDPATRGCVLELVRERHGVPSLQCGHEGGWDPGWDSWTVTNPPGRGHGCRIVSSQCASEAEALVAALEGA